jgi:hypothetical protein
MGAMETTIEWTSAAIEGGYIFVPCATAMDVFEN